MRQQRNGDMQLPSKPHQTCRLPCIKSDFRDEAAECLDTSICGSAGNRFQVARGCVDSDVFCWWGEVGKADLLQVKSQGSPIVISALIGVQTTPCNVLDEAGVVRCNVMSACIMAQSWSTGSVGDRTMPQLP